MNQSVWPGSTLEEALARIVHRYLMEGTPRDHEDFQRLDNVYGLERVNRIVQDTHEKMYCLKEREAIQKENV